MSTPAGTEFELANLLSQAPDIPGIPPGDPNEGANYLAFLVVLKNLLGERSVSIAAPASYWYLKQFPIEQISRIVDYIVYMTYDMHGQVSFPISLFDVQAVNAHAPSEAPADPRLEQWDYGNPWASSGCPEGNCLRSAINFTETMHSLVSTAEPPSCLT